jgi:phosphotransacetylase
MAITKLSEMFDALRGAETKRIVAAYANDSHTIEAVHKAVEMGLISATLVGDEDKIKNVCHKEEINIEDFRVVHEPDEQRAASKAVELINNGEGDILMKGLVSTEKYMRGYS